MSEAAAGTSKGPAGSSSVASPWLQSTTLLSLVIFAIYLAAAIFADFLAPGDPMRGAGQALRPPSSEHWFGTDSLGRDVYGRLVHGARATLLVGTFSALTAMLIGTLIGGISGYAGGIVDDLMMRLVELVDIIPRFFVAVIFAAFMGPSLTGIVLLLGLTMWPDLARIVRSEVLSLKHRAFILAARGLGLREGAIFFRHVVHNVLPVVIVYGALCFGSAVRIQAGLGFLGLANVEMINWGSMLQTAQPYMAIAWWPAVFPGLALTLLILSANLLSDGLTR